ncbi:Hpt domain-containing protein [Planctomicrobium sp. SH668]|uniref:Hpt domain-containing protein n=1 Tax=Planctomicrobium sp. SH668 TaxID=3448126 RepID=UPI003F5B53FA
MVANRPMLMTSTVLHLNIALDRLGQDEELLRELAIFYLEDSPELLREIESAVLSRDFESITRCAHSLKGLSSNFDAEEAVSTAFEVEKCGRLHDLQGTVARLPELRRTMQQVIEALKLQVLN